MILVETWWPEPIATTATATAANQKDSCSKPAANEHLQLDNDLAI
eukprot:CAMPEP_0177542152 /NCGR_PEP_ID=MMETSP0369-20130122/60620_1 /TAXON_ID=447022 ORGANISM="Scrippsiella hangoei-like, Strain SHHI-4" /NCGR_SAMPLE_ID=MMETSP0369 /ASSEMBLY_ACC=CAM_ASM_000364 /LENGTH=44 /DNA_ID= /DNA_START= /DNA_END= /DNA_ORIENTATION=